MTIALFRRLRTRELIAIDVLLAAGLAAICVVAALEAPARLSPEPTWLSFVTGLAIGLPIAVRRLWPLSTTAVVLAVSTAALLSGVLPDYTGAAPCTALGLALYAVGVGVAGRRSVVAAVTSVTVTAVALAAVSTVLWRSSDSNSIALFALVLGVAWFVGRVVRERRAHAARTAEQLTERAVDEERLRIARELHDIVAHSMSLIAVKAAIANHVAEDRPQETRDALRVIEATSRGALAEMRRTVGALRASFTPMPGLADLPALADQAASAGVTVRLSVNPDGAAVPEGVGLAVYRIVQESLTNVVKHAAPANCRADVTVAPGEVLVEVVDDGARVGEPRPGGHGIIGMRERVAVYAGELSAGRRPQGGFTVTARLPYEAT